MMAPIKLASAILISGSGMVVMCSQLLVLLNHSTFAVDDLSDDAAILIRIESPLACKASGDA